MGPYALAVCRAHRGTCWISFAPVFSFIYCWVLIFALSPCFILIYVFFEMMHWYFRGLSCKPNIYVSWSTSELRVRLARRETGFSPPVKYFTDRSRAVLLFWIFYYFFLSCGCYAFFRVCLYVSCGHLLGKGWPLGSHLWWSTVSLSLSHWYPWSGVVLDCIDSWSLHLYLL